MDIWKEIKGYEGLYEVSNEGDIRNSVTGTIKVADISNNGYKRVTLFKNGKGTHKSIHRVVAETFISNLDNKPQVNHINGNKLDNRLENLEWVTQKENTQHAYNNNLIQNNTTPVEQYSLENKLIRVWDSVAAVETELKINHANIVTVCKGNTNRKQAGGYIWKYKEMV